MLLRDEIFKADVSYWLVDSILAIRQKIIRRCVKILNFDTAPRIIAGGIIGGGFC